MYVCTSRTIILHFLCKLVMDKMVGLLLLGGLDCPNGMCALPRSAAFVVLYVRTCQ